MPLQVWEVVVRGALHRVELDRNPESGKHFIRVDGRIAVKPFTDLGGEFPLDLGGRPYLLRLSPEGHALEDRGSRYVDAEAPRGSAIGRVTLCRGLEQAVAITDDALLRVERIAAGLKQAVMMSSGGGAVGALVAGIGMEVAERLGKRVANRFGSTTRDRAIRSFDELQSEVVCRVEHLPIELVSLFAGEADVDARVLVIPRRLVTGIEARRAKLLVRTNASGDTPYKLETGAAMEAAVAHLHTAGYPLDPGALANAGAEALEQAARAKAAAAAAAPIAAPSASASSVVSAGGLPQVRRAAPLLAGIGLDAAGLDALEADAAAYRATYAKTVVKKLRMAEVLGQLAGERFDIVHLLGVYDEKTRFHDVAGSIVSLRDLLAQLREKGARLVWLAGGNDPAPAEDVLRWAGGLNQLTVLTLARGPDHPDVVREAMRRLAAGEPLSATLPEIESRSSCRFRLTGRGEAIFRAD